MMEWETKLKSKNRGIIELCGYSLSLIELADLE